MASDRIRRGRQVATVVLASGALVAFAATPSFAHPGLVSVDAARHAMLTAEMVDADPIEVAELDQLEGVDQGDQNSVDQADQADQGNVAQGNDTQTEAQAPAKGPKATAHSGQADVDQGDQSDVDQDEESDHNTKGGDQTDTQSGDQGSSGNSGNGSSGD